MQKLICIVCEFFEDLAANLRFWKFVRTQRKHAVLACAHSHVKYDKFGEKRG